MAMDNRDELRSQFFDQSDLLFYVLDKDLNLVDVNENGLKTFHFKKDKIIGKNIAELSPGNKESGRFEMYKEVISTGKPVVIEEMKPHPSLGNMYFRIRAFKVGEGLGLISKNITDLKETIDELENFTYKASHDMRSPIASILGLAHIAGTQVNDPEQQKQVCTMIQQQAERLDMILKILVETMRIRKGDKTIHIIDFNKIIDEVLNSLAPMNGFSEVKFVRNISVSGNFYSDKLLLTSLFHNLIENAVKYRRSMSGSCIETSVENENGGVKITIADNGTGIPAHMQKDVYKMFFRATNMASGTGLGLYTVHHTVKKLGGTIQMSSKEKVGTTFTIYLPSEEINEPPLLQTNMQTNTELNIHFY